MALKGSLQDMGVVELVQFPHRGRKTGELIIKGKKGEARLHYKQGALVRIACARQKGFDALVALLGWDEGGFEFETANDIDVPSNIEGELTLTVMRALKVRDEKREEDRQKAKEGKSESVEAADDVEITRDIDAQLNETLERYVRPYQHFASALVLDEDGTVVAEITEPGNEDASPADQVLALALRAYRDYPAERLQRMFFDDGDSVIIADPLRLGRVLVTSAATSTPLGVVFRSLNKVVESLS
jgi:hypothetical protein